MVPKIVSYACVCVCITLYVCVFVHKLLILLMRPTDVHDCTFSPNFIMISLFAVTSYRCVIKDFEKRPFLTDLFNHPFITQVPNDTSKVSKMHVN